MKHAWSRLITGLAVVVLCALVTSGAEAQTGKLTGVVTDAQSGQPLEGAQIALQGTGLSALTGANGRFFLVNIPPSTYTLLVRRIGYQSVEVRNVFIQIDVTRTQDVTMTPATVVTEAIEVREDVVPLVQPGMTGSGSNIRAEEITALPVTSINGVLALQQGFLEVPNNTDLVSFSESRRNPITPIRIRGGRTGETLTLIDQIPINNFVFGGQAFDITREAVEQVDFQRGGFEPQYGNALSGIINIATREGGTNLAGALSYQTSAIGGALGSTPDELRDFGLFEGFLSGPVPGTGNRARFLAAGRNQTGADQVLRFDDDVQRASGRLPDKPPTESNPLVLDLFPGWRAFGYDNLRDLTGKLTYYFTPTAKLSVTGIRYERQRQRFDFDWMLTGFNPLNAPATDNIEDSLIVAAGGGIEQPPPVGGSNSWTYQDVVQGSQYVERTLFAAKWDHTIGRWAYKARAGRFNQGRETCSVWQGVCLGGRFADYNFNDQFVAPIKQSNHPTAGTENIFGGENLTTYHMGLDLQGQATDHHALQIGGSYQRHDLTFQEWKNVGTNDVLAVPSYYAAKPWEAAAYLQDKIEYDFLTVKLGFRFDWGNAGGQSFVDPLNPTNGTTAREECENNPSAYTTPDPINPTNTLQGFAACAVNRDLLAQAATAAQADDFVESGTRTQFSPRIGVSFPLTERSQVFFNFGRYSQNPLYNNVYSNTGIGTIAGDSLGVCGENEVVPGTNQCYPIIYNEWAETPFLGNPNLLIEKTTSYEVGFATELGDQYALQVAAFSKDQFGLSGVRSGGQSLTGETYFDVGSTYGTAIYNYAVIVNQDFQTVRGFELSLRRRLFNYWGFNINFGFAQATTNAAAPELAFQRTIEEGDPENLKEIKSEIDIPATFNASLQFRVGNEEPFGNAVMDAIVRNLGASLTLSARSGLPYTPTLSFQGTGDQQLEQNSGRAPGIFNVNLQASKDFNLSNTRWGVFLQVQNLLDTKNCNNVYSTTGNCDGGTVDQSRRRNGNTVGTGASTTFFDRASYIGARRSLSFGARMSF